MSDIEMITLAKTYSNDPNPCVQKCVEEIHNYLRHKSTIVRAERAAACLQRKRG